MTSTIPRTRAFDDVLKALAIAACTDDQAYASFSRWMEVRHGARPLPSLKDQLSSEDYVAAIFARCPE